MVLNACAGSHAAIVERTVTQTVPVPAFPQRSVPPVVLNVKDFGAQGDWKTNDTAAIQNALDAVAQNGGVVFFPAGGYLVPDGGLVSNKTVTLQGVKGLDGTGSRIMISGTNGVGIQLNGKASVIDSMEITRDSSPAPSVGMVGAVLNSNFGQVLSSRFTGFDTDLRVSGTFYSIRDTSFRDFQSAGLEINNPVARGDAGDGTITGSTFERRSDAPIGGSAVLWLAGGGMRLIDNKINGEKTLLNGVTFAPLSDVTTSSLLINSNSIENFQGAAITVESSEGTILNSLVISDNQIANYAYSPNSQGVSIQKPISNVTIRGNSILATGYGILLDKVFHVTVDGNTLSQIRTDGITIGSGAKDVVLGNQSIDVLYGQQIVHQ